MADASVAWCVSQGSGVAMAAAYLEPAGGARIVRRPARGGCDRRARAAAKAIAVDGGYRVTGLWRFASGSKHSQWLGGHSTVCESDGTPRLRPRRQAARAAHHAVSEVERHHDRRLAGHGTARHRQRRLRGRRTCSCPRPTAFTRESDADRRERGPLYRFSIFNMFGMGFCAVALGIARTMLDDFIETRQGEDRLRVAGAAARQQHDPGPDRACPRRGCRRRAPMCSTATTGSTSTRRAARTSRRRSASPPAA